MPVVTCETSFKSIIASQYLYINIFCQYFPKFSHRVVHVTPPVRRRPQPPPLFSQVSRSLRRHPQQEHHVGTQAEGAEPTAASAPEKAADHPGENQVCFFSDLRLPQPARLAQSVEHGTLNPRVVGSSPTLGAPTLFMDPISIFPHLRSAYVPLLLASAAAPDQRASRSATAWPLTHRKVTTAHQFYLCERGRMIKLHLWLGNNSLLFIHTRSIFPFGSTGLAVNAARTTRTR